MIRGITLIVLLGLALSLEAAPITYQGQLEQSGTPFSGSANLDFRLFDADSGGSQIGTTQERLNWPVTNGQFQVELDFGAGAFDGSERYLEIRINGALMNPRQAVRATPQALVAATTVAGAIGTEQINAAQIQRRVTGSCPTGQYVRSINQAGTVVCGAEPPSWRLGGNAGTDSSSDFIGTLDAEPLELRVANVRGLRLEPSAELFDGLPITANVIAGSHANEVTEGVRGATIAGGGVVENGGDPEFLVGAPNRVTDHYGTVGGGFNNQAGDGAGLPNDKGFATVAGGLGNAASGRSGTVGGGAVNTASGDWSTVGGGFVNTASSAWSTAGGGQNNTASGSNSTVGGGSNNTASGNSSTVGGGIDNTASGILHSTVGGGSNNTASGNSSTVGGGFNNCAGGSHSWAGGRRAKVRPGSASGPPGNGCDGVPVLGTAGDRGTFVWADSTDADFVSTGSNQFLIRSRGGMGINTNAPTAALTVRASADQTTPLRVQDSGGNTVMSVSPTSTILTGNLFVGNFGSGVTSVCRTGTGQISACSSSERYKSNITPMKSSSELIAALTPVRFRWIEDGQEDIGLVAEEVASVIPEIVTYNSKGQVEGVEYSRLGPLLVAGFQEQTAANAERFAALEQDHQRLATENAELRAEVAVLKVQSGQMRELADRNAELEQRLAALESVLLDGGRLAGPVADESP